jgi:hypothetical protein
VEAVDHSARAGTEDEGAEAYGEAQPIGCGKERADALQQSKEET